MDKLIKRYVDKLQPGATDSLYFDGEMPRFGLRVMKTGVKSYLIQYRKDGRTRRFTFGKHGPLTPDQARDQARQLLAAVDRGEDPSQQRKNRRDSPTVSELCERFMDEHVRHRCKPTTQKEYGRSVDKFICPRIGKMKVQDVLRKDIAELHYALRDIPYQANRTLGVLCKLFNLAEIWGIRPDGSNPCRHVPKYKEIKRERYLSQSELAGLGAVLAEVEESLSETPSAVAAFRLLILTGCRLREIQTLKWEYISGNSIYLPDSKTGTKKVALGHAALDVLAEISRIGNNPHVITGRLENTHLTDLEKPWRRIRKKAGLENVRIHDLRHSFASSAVGIGETLPIIGKLLGHTQVQTTARYAHLANDPVQRAVDRITADISLNLNKFKKNKNTPISGEINSRSQYDDNLNDIRRNSLITPLSNIVGKDDNL